MCDLVILENTGTKSTLEFARTESRSASLKQYKDSCMPGVILMNQIAVESFTAEQKHLTNQQLSVMVYDDFLKSDKTKISCFCIIEFKEFKELKKLKEFIKLIEFPHILMIPKFQKKVTKMGIIKQKGGCFPCWKTMTCEAPFPYLHIS